MIALFCSAFFFGIIFNAAPGAVFAESIRRGLKGGFRPALAVQIGSLTGDFLWLLIGVSGAAALLTLPQIRVPLALSGAALLFWFAFSSFRDAMNAPPLPSEHQNEAQTALFAGVALSISNPLNVTYWAAIGSAVTVVTGTAPTWIHFTVFIAGFMTSSVLWCFACAWGIAWTQKRLSPLLWVTLHFSCGLGMIGLAGLIVYHTLIT